MINAIPIVKKILLISAYIVVSVLTFFSYVISIYEYEGKGTNVPKIASMDSITVITVFLVVSIVCICALAIIKRKNKAFLTVSITLLILSVYKIAQILFVMYYVKKGILPYI